MLLASGCIRGDLSRGMRDLHARRQRGSRIVLITPGLKPDAVERSLHAFHRLTRPATRAVE